MQCCSSIKWCLRWELSQSLSRKTSEWNCLSLHLVHTHLRFVDSWHRPFVLVSVEDVAYSSAETIDSRCAGYPSPVQLRLRNWRSWTSRWMSSVGGMPFVMFIPGVSRMQSACVPILTVLPLCTWLKILEVLSTAIHSSLVCNFRNKIPGKKQPSKTTSILLVRPYSTLTSTIPPAGTAVVLERRQLPMADTPFEKPEFYNFPPFFTLQPVLATRWVSLCLTVCGPAQAV